MQTANSGCVFEITRGQRQGLKCGRAVYRKEGSIYCLQHYRSTAVQIRRNEDEPYVQINKPLETPRTVLQPIEEEEELTAWTPVTDEQVNDALIDILTQVKRDIKVNKK